MRIFFDGVQSCKRIFSDDFLNDFFPSLLYFKNTVYNANSIQNMSIDCLGCD